MRAVEPAGVGEPRRPSQALIVVPIVLAVTGAARWLDPGSYLPAALVYAVAVGGAALIGVPLLVWDFERGSTGLARLLALGALAGSVPPVLGLLSGILGLAVQRLPLAAIKWFLLERAPIPIAGPLRWSGFAIACGESAAVGALSAALFWVAVVRRHR